MVDHICEPSVYDGSHVAVRSADHKVGKKDRLPLVSNPCTFKSLPYDPVNDFVPVGMVAKNPFFILAHPSVRASTLTELIALEKSNPGKLAYATDGPRNFSGILAAWINKLAGIGILQVPYATMPQGIQDAIAGRVQLVILAPASAEPFINRGSLSHARREFCQARPWIRERACDFGNATRN
jgi:tripartite-type tricarboxylate transporter receptor subunit TctC